MSLLSTTILISFVIVTVSGRPSLLALNPTILPEKNLLPVENLLPKPYQFGYEIADGLGMHQHRKEAADGSGAVKGSYGYIDALGIKRIVEYTADGNGYNAVIKSNEPGMAGQNSANVLYVVETSPPAAIAQGLKPVVVNSL